MERKQPRILITRLSHIGDCVLTLPLAKALKNRWPDCHISWAMESPTGKLLGDHPDIDQIIQIPKSYLTQPAEVLKLRKRLKEESFDIALDPQSLTKSSFLGWLSGAKVRIGMGGRWKKEFSGWLNNVHITPKTTHLVDRTLQLLDGLSQRGEFAFWDKSPGTSTDQQWGSLANFAEGDATATAQGIETATRNPVSKIFPQGVPEFSIPTSDSDRIWCREVLKECGFLDAGRWEKFGVINPGASWASKRWENARYAKVASELFSRTGFRWIVSWAGEEEKEMAQEIVHKSGEACILAPNSSLKQWTELAKQASVFLGCDTGPMHMAAAVGTPCVVLFGPTKSQDSGPYGNGHVSVQVEYQGGGAKERRKAANDAMKKITVAQVVQACEQVLNRSRIHMAA